MKPLEFCDRCRGMQVGWNRRYLRHRIVCSGKLARTIRLSALTLATSMAVFLFPTSAVSPVATESEVPEAATFGPGPEAGSGPELEVVDPAVAAIEEVLARHTILTDAERGRIASAVVDSGRRHDVDPFLVTGILIAESSGNPYAISHREAVGIMQIHVPTWGETVEAEGINLFLVEDNIDFGTRILRDYTRRYGLWNGVMRYLGASEPTDEAMAYVRRVQGVYSDRQAD